MRVALTVAFLLVLIAPAEASNSCMSKAEARKHFGAVHIYWHGTQHCWDATPKRRHHDIHNVRRTRFTQAQNRFDEPIPQEVAPVAIPDQQPLRMAWVDRWVDVGPPQLSTLEHWLAPRLVFEPKPAPIPTAAPRENLTAALLIILVFVLLCGSIYYWSLREDRQVLRRRTNRFLMKNASRSLGQRDDIRIFRIEAISDPGKPL
jgi:hypothetical protein